ncbi:hypothetical protein K3495_g6472 [Podosphaera aphanis]|nr:hypothetical protein K3495_g6472 [Podosphaera aphanis]
MSKDNFEEADSTDWLNTPLRCLSPVDAAMRCQVCKDFYKTPMITSCCHTFCSLCIRRCLSNDGRCPACRGEEQELKLRNNGAMEELVEAFKNARTEVLTYVKGPTQISTCSPNKRTRFSTECTQKSEDAVVRDVDEGERDHIQGHTMVRCPICDFHLPQSQVNAHLDRNCREEPAIARFDFRRSSKSSQFSQFSNPKTVDKSIRRPERLPNINYSLFKDVQLRKKLGEHGLSQAGPRLAMQRRYTEWITLWNANCDATHPRPPRELKSELDKWERVQEGRIPGPASLQANGPKIKEKDFDGKAWSDSHDGSFKELIKAARQKADKPQSAITPPIPPIPQTASREISHENIINLVETCDSSRSLDNVQLVNNSTCQSETPETIL